VRLHVVVQGDFGQGKRFLLMSLIANDQSFHCLSVGMVRVFAQDLFCGFETCKCWLATCACKSCDSCLSCIACSQSAGQLVGTKRHPCDSAAAVAEPFVPSKMSTGLSGVTRGS
jgi:hypothetical protein